MKRTALYKLSDGVEDVEHLSMIDMASSYELMDGFVLISWLDPTFSPVDVLVDIMLFVITARRECFTKPTLFGDTLLLSLDSSDVLLQHNE